MCYKYIQYTEQIMSYQRVFFQPQILVYEFNITFDTNQNLFCFV